LKDEYFRLLELEKTKKTSKTSLKEIEKQNIARINSIFDK
jgi:ribosomal protein L29